MTTKVRILQPCAGPTGVMSVGSVHELVDPFAQRLIAAGRAELVRRGRPPKHRERATREASETA